MKWRNDAVLEGAKRRMIQWRRLTLTTETKGNPVIGIGGVFFRARNPKKLSNWYRKHLGIQTTQNTALFTWKAAKNTKRKGHTVWAVFPSNTDYFHNFRKQFMINYRVKNLQQTLQKLRAERVKIARNQEKSVYGEFAWVSDPEGNWLELWEPPKKYIAPEEEMPME